MRWVVIKYRAVKTACVSSSTLRTYCEIVAIIYFYVSLYSVGALCNVLKNETEFLVREGNSTPSVS